MTLGKVTVIPFCSGSATSCLYSFRWAMTSLFHGFLSYWKLGRLQRDHREVKGFSSLKNSRASTKMAGLLSLIYPALNSLIQDYFPPLNWFLLFSFLPSFFPSLPSLPFPSPLFLSISWRQDLTLQHILPQNPWQSSCLSVYHTLEKIGRWHSNFPSISSSIKEYMISSSVTLGNHLAFWASVSSFK